MFSNQFDDDEHSKYGMSAAKVKYWMDDSQAPRCMRCSCEFSAIIRRHHCRKCGEIICDDCCKVKLLIPLEEMVFPPEKAVLSAFEQDAAEPQKVCSTCAMDLLPLQTELQRTIAKAQRPEATALDRAALRRYFNAPFSFSLADQIKKASYTLLNFTAENQLEGADTLPRELLWEAEGIAILTFVKAGFFFHGSVRHGAGGGPAARGGLERALGRRLQRRGVGFPNRRGGDGCGGGSEHAVRRGSLHFKRTGVAGYGAERVGGAAGARRGHGRARGRRRGHRRLQLRPQQGPVCWSFTGGSSADCTG
mmetsp:Transcript_7315/g.12170  ORF Transcript_7315/g.12170 Transcript_7315/m.12170 type:complete len:307 (+) Transcript_7315:76-996(+)